MLIGDYFPAHRFRRFLEIPFNVFEPLEFSASEVDFDRPRPILDLGDRFANELETLEDEDGE